MKLPPRQLRRGQPLTALGVLLVGWVGVRSALWAAAPPTLAEPVAVAEAEAAGKSARSGSIVSAHKSKASAIGAPVQRSVVRAPAPAPARQADAPNLQGRAPEALRPVEVLPLDREAAPATEVTAPVPPRVAAAHLLMRMQVLAPATEPETAALAQAPVAKAVPAAVAVPYLPSAATEALRWSADGWVLWREGRTVLNRPGAGLPGVSFPTGTYGASQAGLVLRYRLAPDSPLRPALYLRASSGLYAPRGEELAAGLSLRPVPKLPIAVMGEARVTRTVSGDIVRPALAAVTELPAARLPGGLRGEAYVQAGWVGGAFPTGFVDGQARIEKPVWRAAGAEFRLGGGTWGGAQKGARRIDAGPTATLDLPVGRVNTRLSADYRLRVAGDAAPGSGVAVTFSAGF